MKKKTILKHNFKKIITSIFILMMFILNIITISSISPYHDSNTMRILDEENTFELSDEIKEKLNQNTKNFEEIFHFSNKVEESLYRELGIYSSSTSNQEKYDIIIIFKEFLSKEQRISVIDQYSSHYIIKYNFNIIPAVSLSLPTNDLIRIIDEISSIQEISLITKNHQTQLSSNYEVIKNNNYNNTAPFSFDNWWLETVGAIETELTGEGVKISIIDTGIGTHPDFFKDGDFSQPRIIASKNFTYEEGINQANYTYDDYGHGTHVAGIAAGNGITSEGKYKGVAPEALLLNAKASNSSGSLKEDDIIAAIEWSVEQGADIISMSFGDVWPEVWSAEALAVKKASEQGVILVSSAGNSGSDLFTSGSPASTLHSISVGASDINNNIATFSSLGPSHSNQLLPDIVAPGRNIIAPLSPDSLIDIQSKIMNTEIAINQGYSYISMSGTSMSAPIVAGAIALLLEQFPNATPESIRNALLKGASKINRPTYEGYGNAQGAGLLNITASINYLESIKANYNDENWQLAVYPSQIPYAPFDLLRFPGDAQQFNLTLYSGNQTSFYIDFSQVNALQGLKFESELIGQNISLSDNGLISIPINVKILHNASVGERIASIPIRHDLTNDILDTIDFSITVAHSRGKIVFDSFHSLIDSYPSSVNMYRQYNFYHSIRALYEMNYSVDYVMQNWTARYDFREDAEIIHEAKLSDADVLVLQTPIIPYSEYELDVMKNFHDSGGSILFLGTRSENIAVNSINSLFDKLGVGISISNQNLMDLYNNGFYAYYSSLSIVNFSESSPIFQNVEEFEFDFGTKFELNDDAQSLFTYNEHIIGAHYPSINERGKVVAFGDYHFLRDGVYNNPSYHGNHSTLLENLMNYLIEPQNEDIGININIEKRELDTNNFNISANIFNYNTMNSISGLLNGTTINMSLIYPNQTHKTLDIFEMQSEGVYNANLDLNILDSSNETLSLNVSVDLDGEKLWSLKSFYYYPEIINGYSNVTTTESYFTRELGNNYDLIFEFEEAPSNNIITTYVGITTNSFLSRRNVTEIKKDMIFNGTEYVSPISSSELITGGIGYAYGFSKIENTQGDLQIDLSPNRFAFRVLNNDPLIDINRSNLGGIVFSETQYNDSIVLITAETEGFYSMELFANETVEYEDSNSELDVRGGFLQVYAFGGYIHLLSTSDISPYIFNYNEENDFFEGYISFPEQLYYNRFDERTELSTKSDQENVFSLLIITVTDRDGGYDDFYFLIVLDIDESESDFSDYWPLLVLIGIVVVICIYLNRRGKKNSDLNNQYGYDPNRGHYYSSQQFGPKNEPERDDNYYDDSYY